MNKIKKSVCYSAFTESKVFNLYSLTLSCYLNLIISLKVKTLKLLTITFTYYINRLYFFK